MAWVDYNRTNSDEGNKDIVWDLRRIQAEKILGVTLQEIKLARKLENFPEWFKLLKRDLRVETFKNYDEKERSIIMEQIRKTKEVLFKYGQTYLGKNKNAMEHELVEEALCELEILMTTLMQSNNLYGSREDDEGL